MNRIAEVAVPRDIHKTFDYAIPDNFGIEIEPGMRVEVPFRNETLTGCIIQTKSKSDFKGKLSKLKAVIDEERVVSKDMLQLAYWIADYYICPIGMVLPAMIPSSLGKRKRASRNYVQLLVDLEEAIKSIESFSKAAPQQAKILNALLAHSETPLAQELLAEIGSTYAPLKSLEKKGLVRILRRPTPIEITSDFRERPSEHKLTSDQNRVLAQLSEALKARTGNFLLHGVNASGKTEVYMRAVQHCISLGRQSVVLVPEISLTPQLLARFEARFGKRLASYHSQLTDAERNHEWTRIHSGEVDVVIGVRSAIFAPFTNLGLIIIDEEHEGTYKQDDPMPRYHAREVALKRAEIERAVVVLGSATPSLESFFAAQRGDLELLEMAHRISTPKAPDVHMIDLANSQTILSKRLGEAIEKRLKAKEQILLLLNLRGFSRAAICGKCREAQRCSSCKLALVYHLKEQRLVCHLCNHSYPVSTCRNCKADALIFVGFGTEQAEHEIRAAFPDVRLARMDSDVMKRGLHGETLEAFRSGEIQILLGTQMIGLGLDFPNVTLVGILSADSLINIPDFRSGERTFQLLSQAIGRTGRGDRPGEVYVQTRQPDNYALQCAAKGNYRNFYSEEIEYRELFSFPPYSTLIKLTCEGKNEENVSSESQKLYESLNNLNLDQTDVLEPSRAQPYRVRGEYRMRVIAKTRDFSDLRAAIREILNAKRSGVQLKVDVDPSSLTF